MHASGITSLLVRDLLLLSAISFSAGVTAGSSDTLPAIPSSEAPEVSEAFSPHKSLSDLLVAAPLTQQFTQRVRRDAQRADRSLEGMAPLIAQQALLERIGAELSQAQAGESRLTQLMDIDTQVTRNARQLNDLIEAFSETTQQLESALEQLDQHEAQWVRGLELIQTRQAPDSVHALATGLLSDIRSTRLAAMSVRDRLLDSLAQATQLHRQFDAVSSELVSRQEAVIHSLRSVAYVPLWTLGLSAGSEERQAARNALGTWISTIRSFLDSSVWQVVFLSLAGATLVRFLFGRAQVMLREHLPYARMARAAFLLLERPYSCSALVMLLGLNFLPQAPIAYHDLLWLWVLIPAVSLSLTLHGPAGGVSVVALGVLMIPMPFRTVLEYLPRVDRWALALQAFGMAAAMAWDGWRFRTRRTSPWLNRAALLLVAALLVAFIANSLGHIGAARVLVDGILGTLAFAMVYHIAMEILFVMLLGLWGTPLAQWSRLLSRHPRDTAYALRRLLAMLTTGMIIFGGTYAFRFQEEAGLILDDFWQAGFMVGTTEIPVRSLMLAAIILWITRLLTRITSPLLEVEILPRFRLAAGLPYAISTMTRYAIAMAGFVLGLLALGIDLSRVSILAGALGVGVGFGLQNIFNNFISGVILLFERPIHVNDVIEIGGLRGAITRIGIRSSTVKTAHGAEVIVPNADLIAKEVINWTLSDRRRRLEIPIGVAYGTAVDRMLTLLLDIAQGCEEVLASPEPAAMFNGFGDSSLDFMLHVWIERYEDNLRIASDLRIAINARLAREGIEIPYPQQDVHIRSGQALHEWGVQET